MFLSTTATNLNAAGVWFFVGGLAMPQIAMHALGPFVPVAGKAARVDAAGCFSSRGPVPIAGGTYPGYPAAPAFTASRVVLTSFDPTQNNAAFNNGVFTPANDPKFVQLGAIFPADIAPSGQPFCYQPHRHGVTYPYQPADLDGLPRWLAFLAECSSGPAGPNDWLNWEQNNGECFFSAETEYAPG